MTAQVLWVITTTKVSLSLGRQNVSQDTGLYTGRTMEMIMGTQSDLISIHAEEEIYFYKNMK